MAAVDFDYGSLYGPVIETAKTDMETLAYGSLYGPVVGVETAAPPAGLSIPVAMHHYRQQRMN